MPDSESPVATSWHDDDQCMTVFGAGLAGELLAVGFGDVAFYWHLKGTPFDVQAKHLVAVATP